ncbi:hypothetical protein J437_LFUL004039 [Ladona fulva]|uniref:Uncharacterized protein n=1 Tax=Ladona fulva TaxID=123851 RepID=A0A8K0JWI0_LADFU|nr:hypothetical protein J437_LFUL004039 [Ladona fulva]
MLESSNLTSHDRLLSVSTTAACVFGYHIAAANPFRRLITNVLAVDHIWALTMAEIQFLVEDNNSTQ